ncbi:MAG: aldehyde ferredoxin oxidoreductase family protein [Clostridia bacterium]|nr:aldehyde ferredoxin oxidoreductase family protein [Clostridia bacterium]
MSTNYGGYMGKVLMIDVSTKETSEYNWTDQDRRKYLGGKTMAAKIISDLVAPDVGPFSEDNVLAITTGPLTGTNAPASARFNISTISPLTNILTSSNCGGNFGLFLKKAGYDSLIIKGKSPEKIWIEVTEDGIEFHDADDLWGAETTEAQERLPAKTGKLVIGPAGENLVYYAGVFSQERTAGRGGVGAIFGSKNIKAITAAGTKKPEIKEPEKTKAFYKKWIDVLKKHPITGHQLPKLGTAGLVSKMQSNRVLATKNFKAGVYEDYYKVSGEELAEKHLIKNKGCVTCPMQCGRVVNVHGKNVKGPELETLGLLGPNILNNDIEKINEWNLLLDELGMDTISTAGVIAFSMELNEKGLWDNGLEFGKTDNISQIFKDIAHQRGIGKDLSKGVKYLSEKYGGKEFAMHSKGMELSAYEPRHSVGLGLGYAVSNRGGCHLNAGYLILFEALALAMNPFTTRSKAELTHTMQNLMEAISSAGLCLFTSYTTIPPLVIKKPNGIAAKIINSSLTLPGVGAVVNGVNRMNTGLKNLHVPILPYSKAIVLSTGMPMNLIEFLKIGRRGFNLERKYNVSRGITSKDDALPSRLTDVIEEAGNKKSKVPLEKLKQNYYKSRGWDKNGIPIQKTLRKVGL